MPAATSVNMKMNACGFARSFFLPGPGPHLFGGSMCGYELFIKWQWHSEQRQEQEQVVTKALECVCVVPKKKGRIRPCCCAAAAGF